jgi:hypothetical protein
MKKSQSKPDGQKAPSALTPDMAQKLLDHDIARIVMKVKGKKPLTAPERNLLAQMADREEGSEDPITRTPDHVTTVTALAGILGVTRRSIQKWRKKYASEIPKNRTNGDYDVVAWRAFVKRKGLKEHPEEADEDPEDADDMDSLKKRDLRARAEEREFKLSVLRGDFIAADEVRESIAALVAEAIKMLRDKFENELPPVCAGLDAVRIRAEASRAIDDVCSLLHRGEATRVEIDDDDDE